MPAGQNVSAWITKRDAGWCLVVAQGSRPGRVVPVDDQEYFTTREALVAALQRKKLTVQDGNYVRLSEPGKKRK